MKISLNTQIFIAAVLGVAYGFLLTLYPKTSFFDGSIYALSIASGIFIGLLKMLLVPLIFSSIVVGVSNLQAGGQFGRVWKITLICCFTTTTLALILGIACTYIFEVGKGMDISLFKDAMSQHQTPDTLTPGSFLTNFIQNTLINPFKAFSDGNVLAVVVFAFFVGAALVKGGEHLQSIRKLLQQFFNMMMMLVGVRPQTAGFVIPIGSQMNMDGTALYEAAAALFIANLIGLDLSVGQQIIVCLTAMIASLGAPGIPSAGMVTMIMVLQSVGLPAEAIAILLPIDRILDTVRTVVNVQGDMMISVVVDRYTKESDELLDVKS